MERMRKMCDVVETELDKIAEKGLTTSNLDTAYKLIDMYKDLKNVCYWDTKGEYYEYVLSEMQGGYSDDYPMDDYSMRGRKRDRMGRYSRDDGMMHDDRMRRSGRHDYSMSDGTDMRYNRYMDSKQSYRNDKSADGKQRLMDSLEDYMDNFTDKIKEMHRDADTPEERELISKFMGKLQSIR